MGGDVSKEKLLRGSATPDSHMNIELAGWKVIILNPFFGMLCDIFFLP